ncbi:MAG: PPC domain-containing protein, partial [Verrucomicrobiae bacterium]|nr:PPC domain-containing protein [Verrucomicrobiae bacterium]NNJ87096.1 peptidase [Akkermansiaceae bacterium]
MNTPRAIITGMLSLLSATLIDAYSPELGIILPRGGERGKDVEVNLYGKRMLEPQELIFYNKGITVKALTKVKDTHVKALLSIAADAPLGEHPIRLRCRGGMTYMRTFWVGQYPTVKELEPNNDYAKPQVVELNSTVHGVAGTEDADYYQVTAKKGQRVSAEVEGMRLGTVFFDPYIAILDSRRFEMATSDDAPLLRQDAFVSVVAPEDGQYTILVRESSYEGNDRCRYRLHIGGFTRPTVVYPPAAKPGVTTTFRMIGDPAGDFDVQVTPDGKNGSTYSLFAQRDGQSSPSPNPVVLSNLPFANEKEPNNASKQATTKAGLTAPCAFNGIISQKGDVDWFRFSAKKGQNLRIRVRARSLRSPLDSILILRDAKGKQIARNDDQGGLDSIIDFKPPVDGDYFVNVRDHLGKGGPSYTYRVEIDSRKPSLSATLPVGRRNDSQYRKMICVPRGNRYATVVNISRQNIGCECKLEAGSLPKGVSMRHSPAPKSANNFVALFEAASDAPVAGGLHHLTIRHAKSDSAVRGDLKEVIHHIEINNTGTFHSTYDDRIAMAVIEEAPFHIDLHIPPVPIVKNGTAQLKIHLRRKPGFDGAVKVTLPWKPPGIGSPTDITIPKGKSEAVYKINANADA